MTKSRGILHPKRWTVQELAILRRDYPDRRAADIAERLGRKISHVHSKATKLGLLKSDVFKASDMSGRVQRGKQSAAMKATQFKPGQKPANTGLRRPGWFRGRMRETMFKKGTRSGVAVRLYKPVGAERVNGDGYLDRKINDDLPLQARWKAVHRIVWEEANGPIPKDHVVCFRKGQKTVVREEITIARLELVPRAELARRNRMWTLYPPDVAKAIHLVGQLRRRIRQKERHAEES